MAACAKPLSRMPPGLSLFLADEAATSRLGADLALALKAGDLIQVRAGRREITYRITERKLLVEKDQSIEVRTQNAQYIVPGGDDRLTLVTCWPPDNNSHRIIIIARPVAETLDAQR